MNSWRWLKKRLLIRVHFDPRNPNGIAKIVLLENSGTNRAGDVLGDAQLIGETAAHIRSIMEWASDDRRAGYAVRQKVAHFARRVSRGIGFSGRIEYSSDEYRNGLGIVSKLERIAPKNDPAPAVNTPPVPPPDLSRLSAVHVGKIGRLPLDLRDEVCRRLADNQPSEKILAWLNGLPQVKKILDEQFGGELVSARNLSNWRQGGFRAWQSSGQPATDPPGQSRAEREAKALHLKTFAARNQIIIP
jgi:hypothetical protein